MSTKLDFICEYKRELLARYDWAQDEARLAKFMLSLHKTPHGTKNLWNNDGEAVIAAWRAIGGPAITGTAKPSYKALRALPD